MKVRCQQDDLQRALSQVSRAVASKTALPVLANILLATEEDRLRIAATNLEIGITTFIKAAVEEEGRITVDARLLADFVNTLSSAPVELAVEPSRSVLSVTSGRDKAGINGIDADDFPVIPSLGEETEGFSASVDPQLLREMITHVEFAAATDDSRPVLAGVLTRFEERKLTLATCDGFRLAIREGELSESLPEKFETIVPARAMREMARLIGDTNEPVQLAITQSRNQLLARIGETEFLSRLIEGMFPDVMQIVPKESATRVELGRDRFLTAVRQASLFARDNNDVIRLQVHPGEDELAPGTVEISANAAERGSSQGFVDAAITGSKDQVAFNSRYLTDVLGVVRHGEVVLGLNGPNQAGVLRYGDEQTQAAYTYVIMPMVTSG
ncbi:MAG TPA: DNA polymerase III subunit beta [Thermomicrobiales bacterium]|nr:DNA polymerase III subunit beta [Thermomicrobiales bacterium]